MPFVLVFLALISTVIAATNPFESLSEKELIRTAKILKEGKYLKENVFVAYAANYIPPKADVLAKLAIPRRALVQLFDRKTAVINEYIVSLEDGKVALVRTMKNQPHILTPEYDEVSDIVKKHPKWIEAIKKRGLNPADVYIDGWAPGLLKKAELKTKKRFMRAISYYQGKNENMYARPIEGLIVTVNMSDGVVHEVWDSGAAPVAAGDQDFNPDVLKPRTSEFMPLKKLEVNQPNGPSFKMENGVVVWNNWRLRYSFEEMKGLRLHQVEFLIAGLGARFFIKDTFQRWLFPTATPLWPGPSETPLTLVSMV